MTVKELKEKLENLNGELTVAMSISDDRAEESDTIVYVADSSTVELGVPTDTESKEGLVWIYGHIGIEIGK